MTYEQYEDAVVGLLNIDGADTQVLPYVEKLNEPRNTHKPRLYVLLNGGKFDEEGYLDVSAQQETINCEIFITATKRRGEMGIFVLADEVRKRLLGYRLPDAKDAITLNSFNYVNGGNNEWMYSIAFQFTRIVVAEDRGSEADGTINQITTKLSV
jgi:hypothetical protein